MSKPNKGLWGNPETSHSRKLLPLPGWRDKGRRWGYPSPGPGMAQRKPEPWQASGESCSQGREAAAARGATPVQREREKRPDFPFLLLPTLPPEPPVHQTQLGASWQGAWEPEPGGSGTWIQSQQRQGEERISGLRRPEPACLHDSTIHAHCRQILENTDIQREEGKNHDFISFFQFYWYIIDIQHCVRSMCIVWLTDVYRESDNQTSG